MKPTRPVRCLVATLLAALAVAAQAHTLPAAEAGARNDRLAQVVQALRGDGHRGAATAAPPALAWLGLLAGPALLAGWLRRRKGDAVMTIGDGGEAPVFCVRP